MGVVSDKKPKWCPTTWGGFAVSAAALAAILVNGPVPEPAATDGLCAPGESAARVADPAYPDSGSLTAEEAAEFDRLLHQAAVPHRAPNPRNPQTVDVVFHVVSHPNGTGNLDQDTIDEQIRVLNKAFSGDYGGVDTGFRFALEATTRTQSSDWFTDFSGNEKKMKRKLRRGGAETLNIYSLNMGEGLLGRASFPQEYRRDPRGDGIVIDYRTVPGGSYTKFNLGHTATHETGHWLGLFHTFQNGCASPGDYVFDTPYEREQATGCPTGRDTCPHRRGLDPVNNYMNYSDDPCLKEFTRGQAERMAMSWTAFRG